MAAREPSRRYAVKDSFARLDLAAEGLTPLFEAEWIAYGPAPAGPGDPGLCWDAVADARELSMWKWHGPGASAQIGRCSGQNSWATRAAPSWPAAAKAISSPGSSPTPLAR